MYEDSIMSMVAEEKYKLKIQNDSRIVIVGETGVGKTTLFKSFLGETQNDITMVDKG
jgi:ABC-type bacteriocin/lantibiotic exporter with double-glycine peptidase domain